MKAHGNFLAILSFYFLTSPGIAIGQSVPVETMSAKQELLDSLETSTIAAKQSLKMDCIGESYVSEQFFDHLARANVTRFRLQIDRQEERLSWASETRLLPSDIDPNAAGLKYHFCTIAGGELTSGDGVGVARKQTFSDFETALLQCGVPLPEYWGIAVFPFNGNGDEEIDSMRHIVLDSKVEVAKDVKSKQIEFTLRREMPVGEPSQTFEWRFDLPEILISKIRFCRVTDGKPLEYYKQIVEFEEFENTQRPILISGDSLIIGNDLQKVLRLGKRETTTQLRWLHPESQISSEFRVVMNFENVIMIEKFLAHGKQQLRNSQ